MTVCNQCQHLERVGGRIVQSRCPVTGVTFPAPGVSCSALGKRGERTAEISPETFSCKRALPLLHRTPAISDHGITVINGNIVAAPAK